MRTAITLINPSRSRPNKSAVTMNSFIANRTSDEYIEMITVLDWDDPEGKDYQPLPGHRYVTGDNKSAVDAINYGAAVSHGDFMMVVSDDTACFKGWDSFLLKWLYGKSDFIAKTQDGVQPWIITNPILDRAYYNRFGYIYHPDYQHMFCDTELTCVADLTGRKITSNILFKHNHYSVTKEAPDAISKKADGTWDQGEKLFLERYKRNFDLPADQIKGKIQDNGMINWLKRKVR